MKDKIETILIGALFGDDTDEELLVSSFISCIELALQGKDIFTLVPDTNFKNRKNWLGRRLD